MLPLFIKEISAFLTSLIGHLVVIVFLIATGLFLWVFPGEMNVLEMGYSNIDGLFFTAPWVFMFLVPAITMRSFAEEKRTGTIELLFTRPLTDFDIIMAKYFAGVAIVILALLPTLIYFFSVTELGSPQGNADTGGIWGSYIGLFFLAGAFAAIGIFSSSVTDNQIVAFIVAVSICFFCFFGFQSLSELALFKTTGSDIILLFLSIQDHYASMSHGVIDTRDVIYFISIAGFFILLTKLVLNSRKW